MASSGTATFRVDLAAPFEEFNEMNDRMGFIAPRVLPQTPVGVQAAQVPKIPVEQLLQDHDTDRAPGANYKRNDFEWDYWTYATEEKGTEEPMDDRVVKIYGDIINAEEIHSRRAIDFVLRGNERDVAALAYDTGTFTNDPVATAWNNVAATPTVDVFGRLEAVENQCGITPNGMTMNRLQVRDLMLVNEIIDRIKFWGGDDPKNINPEMLANIFDLDFILVSGSFRNIANVGQDASFSRIWANDKVLVAKFAVTSDLSEPCIGRTPMWNEENSGLGDERQLSIIVEEYREEARRGSVFRARHDRDNVIIYKEAGSLLTGVRV